MNGAAEERLGEIRSRIDKAARLLESAARRGAEPPTRLVEVIRAKSVDAAETATNL